MVRPLLLLALVLAAASAPMRAQDAKPLEIHFIDVEGG